jgi:hypothetical protein
LEHVEKDYWLMESIRGLVEYGTQHHLDIVLKGGTSLSKGYKLIKRFSEDADTVIIFGDHSVSQRDAHLKGFVNEAEVRSGLSSVSDNSQSGTGKNRVVTLDYPSEIGDRFTDARVKVELHTVGGIFPCEPRELRSLLSEFWNPAAGEISEFDELAPFTCQLQQPCRTLVEKLVLLHEAHTRNDESAKYRRIKTVRHYYDIWYLLESPLILADLERHGVAALSRDVCMYSMAADYRFAERPSDGFALSTAFEGQPTRAVRTAYDKQVRSLAWFGSYVPTFNECVARVQSMGGYL